MDKNSCIFAVTCVICLIIMFSQVVSCQRMEVKSYYETQQILGKEVKRHVGP